MHSLVKLLVILDNYMDKPDLDSLLDMISIFSNFPSNLSLDVNKVSDLFDKLSNYL
jgi:hypothetical protein